MDGQTSESDDAERPSTGHRHASGQDHGHGHGHGRREGRAQRRRSQRLARYVLAVLLVYIGVAYLILPWAWEAYLKRHPELAHHPRVTETADGHPGDPLNVALVGTRDELLAALPAAGWQPAAALGLAADLRIAADTLLDRPDDEAPVSSLYLFGRKEDLAFEQPVGDSPRKRHHVRFWQTDDTGQDGRPLWIGSASYDERVGLSHTTGQVTHHIAPDVDTERDRLFVDLKRAGCLSSETEIPGFHTVREGVNGGGDHWYTDGTLRVGTLRAGGP